jgi:hypothetical protein
MYRERSIAKHEIKGHMHGCHVPTLTLVNVIDWMDVEWWTSAGQARHRRHQMFLLVLNITT